MTRGFPKANDVLFTTEGATLGNTCRIPKNLKQFAIGQRLITLVCCKLIVPEFLQYILIQDKTKSLSDDAYLEVLNVPRIIGNKNPSHLFKKRAIDFDKNLNIQTFYRKCSKRYKKQRICSNIFTYSSNRPAKPIRPKGRKNRTTKSNAKSVAKTNGG